MLHFQVQLAKVLILCINLLRVSLQNSGFPIKFELSRNLHLPTVSIFLFDKPGNLKSSSIIFKGFWTYL
jgi:hypothetical protein